MKTFTNLLFASFFIVSLFLTGCAEHSSMKTKDKGMTTMSTHDTSMKEMKKESMEMKKPMKEMENDSMGMDKPMKEPTM